MIPRYARPMIGWPLDARRQGCGCVRIVNRWHLCADHRAELGRDMREVDND